jgi:hypothetical protein
MKPMVPFISCPRSKFVVTSWSISTSALVCGPALKILDEVQQSFPVNSLERLRRPWKNAHLLGPLRSLEYRHILFYWLLPVYDWLDSEVYFCKVTYWAPLEMLLSLWAILSYIGYFISGVHFESLELAMKCRMRVLTWIKQMHTGDPDTQVWKVLFPLYHKKAHCLRGWTLVMQEQCGLPHCLALLHTISPNLIWRRVSSWYMPGTSQMHSLFLCLAFYEIIKMSSTKTFVSTFKSSLLHLPLHTFSTWLDTWKCVCCVFIKVVITLFLGDWFCSPQPTVILDLKMNVDSYL